MPEIDGFEQAYSPPRNRGFNGLHLEVAHHATLSI